MKLHISFKYYVEFIFELWFFFGIGYEYHRNFNYRSYYIYLMQAKNDSLFHGKRALFCFSNHDNYIGISILFINFSIN